MKKLKQLRTAFAVYEINGSIGEGGNGHVYKAHNGSNQVAIKILKQDKSNSEKLKRFKNEYLFCAKSDHLNIIKATDHGIDENGCSFFVMPLYKGSLKELIGKLDRERIFKVMTQILDGVEAAHKLGVVHRDLKPENILFGFENDDIVITDFGIAEFNGDDVYTDVDTKEGTRLANFQYASPEQRVKNKSVTQLSDIYALGLMISELFTGEVPFGKNHKMIGQAYPDCSYMDSIVDKMIQQNPSDRYPDISTIKHEISIKAGIALTQQKINHLSNQVIPADSIDDPLINDPVKIIGTDWYKNQLFIKLNHKININWMNALRNMGSYTSVLGRGPETFNFSGDEVFTQAYPDEAQRVVDYFKQWIPQVNRVYEMNLKQEIQRKEKEARDAIARSIALEETRKKVLMSIKI